MGIKNAVVLRKDAPASLTQFARALGDAFDASAATSNVYQ